MGKRNYQRCAKILLLDSEKWAFEESTVTERSYVDSIKKIRVDTIRNIVIIATGGKIGNPHFIEIATGTGEV